VFIVNLIMANNLPFLFAVSALIPLIFLQSGFHIVQEGHVGIYFRGGALLDSITDPGYHFKFPFFTSFENVQVTV
jgi:regulator of protease activity HflC (stomatin/prohibitin superfamily)